MTASLTRTILNAIRSDGFNLVRVQYLTTNPGVQYNAWRAELGPVRPPDAERWSGHGVDDYTAAVALAEALGWTLDE